MQHVIVSDVAGTIPTTSQITTKQIGVNTANGKMYVNNGTKIRRLGGSVWKPTSNTEEVELNNNTTVGTWVTVVDLVGPLMLCKARLTVSGSSNTGDIRVTRDGVLLPVRSITTDVSAQTLFVDVVGTFGENFLGNTTNQSLGVTTMPVYCEESLKVEIRGSNSSIVTGTVGFSYGELV